MRMAQVTDDERTQWCIDNWEAVAAEIGAELGISRNRASAQMNYGVELLERLPRLGGVFAFQGHDDHVAHRRGLEESTLAHADALA